MNMTIEQMKAAVAAAEAEAMAAIVPAGFLPRGDGSFHCGKWSLLRQPAWSSGPGRRWRALRFIGGVPARFIGDGFGDTPAEAIAACKADMLAVSESAAAAALELPEVTP